MSRHEHLHRSANQPQAKAKASSGESGGGFARPSISQMGNLAIQRECDPSRESCMEAPVCSESAVLAPTEGPTCSLLDPAQVTHGPDYDPCKVNVRNLTNYELLAEYSAALAVVNQGRSATGYFDHRNLQRRLIEERDRRVDMGHAWLATMPNAIPGSLYSIVDGPMGTFDVIAVAGETVSGPPTNVSRAPLMTQAQFDRFLSSHNVERVDADTYRMRVSAAPSATSTVTPSPTDPFGLQAGAGGEQLPLFYLNPVAGGTLGPTPAGPGITVLPYEGVPLPRVFTSPVWLSEQPGYMQADLLANPPAMDPARAAELRARIDAYRRAPGVPPRGDPGLVANLAGDYRALGLAAPVETPAGTSVTGGTVALAQTDIPGLSANFPGASAEALPPHLRGTPGTTGGAVLVPANPTAVNHAEHVALESLRISIEAALERGTLTRPELRGRTVFLMVEQEPCSSCAAGAAGGEARPGVIEQFARLYPEVTIEVRNMRTSRAYIYRGGVLLNPSGATLPVEAPALPELAPQRPPLSGGKAIGFGGTAGGLVAIATSAGVMLIDTAQHPNWAQELAVAGGLGTGAGITGTATELGITHVGQRVMQSGATRLTPGLTTGLGRFGGGAVGAMFIESVSMGLLEEREHSGLEVGTRLGRSAVLGGGSVWAGATVGAAVGSAVPVAGTAVGFIVGLAVGGVLYYVGDKVVPGGREDWDAVEAGCTPLPTLERWRAPATGPRMPFSSPPFTCFLASTRVYMADGSQKSIGSLAPGDEVLSYNEATEKLEPRRVEKVHAMPPTAHLVMHFANGSLLRVTPTHKLFTPEGWMSALEVNTGESVYVHGAAPGNLTSTPLLSREYSPASEGVYDLSINTTHTYFAESVLAHNKLP